MNNKYTIGFIGVGMITTAVVEGFCDRIKTENRIILANRTKQKAEELADRFPGKAEAVGSFQECVDKSDIVVIAVLPNAAKEVISSLKFRPEQRIVSFVFPMAKEEIEPLLNCDVISVTHMLPGTFVSMVSGPIISYPKEDIICEVFGEIGTMVSVDKREDEKKLACLTGMFAPVFSVEDTMVAWCEGQGLSKGTAFKYASALMTALATEAQMSDADTLHKLATVNTPGGINMQAVDHIKNAGGFDAFSDALDGIYKRFLGN